MLYFLLLGDARTTTLCFTSTQRGTQVISYIETAILLFVSSHHPPMQCNAIMHAADKQFLIFLKVTRVISSRLSRNYYCLKRRRQSIPPVAELLLKTPLLTKASSALKSQRNQQDIKKPSSNTIGIHMDYRKLGLDNRQGSSQGRHIHRLMWQAVANNS